MLSSVALAESAELKSTPPERDAPPSSRLQIQRSQRRVLKFTADEDGFLKEGIDKHGFGQWTAILRDPEYTFQKISEGRTADSLKKSAGLSSSSLSSSL